MARATSNEGARHKSGVAEPPRDRSEARSVTEPRASGPAGLRARRRRTNILILPQPSRAAMTCPSPPPWLRAFAPVQCSAGIGLEIIHHLLGWDFRFDDGMHVIGSHMRSEQTPTAARADFGERLKYHRTAFTIQCIRGLIHTATFRSGALWIGFRQSASKQIVPTVYRTRFISVKMRAVAAKSDEVPHSQPSDVPPGCTAPYGCGSVTRGSA